MFDHKDCPLFYKLLKKSGEKNIEAQERGKIKTG